jgi:uncharacterized protein involved in exopolysaccharide biosynthesis
VYNSAAEDVQVPTAAAKAYILRRWKKVILISALAGLLAGFLLSYTFAPMYKSYATVLVRQQTVSEDVVQPLVTADLGDRIGELEQRVLGTDLLHPMIERLGLAKSGQSMEDISEDIRTHISIEPLNLNGSRVGAGGKKTASQSSGFVGFTVSYTASSPHDAQQICAGLTDLLLTENLKLRHDSVNETIEFLDQEVRTVSQNLEALDKRAKTPASGDPGTLALEREIQKKTYVDLLTKLSRAQAAANIDKDLEAEQLGEQMQLQFAADLPDAPIFPDRLLFAQQGLGAGMALGIALVLWSMFKRATEVRSDHL